MSQNNIKIAATCWRHGNESVAKESWDYAIQMYAQAVRLCPDNLNYRTSLRAAEYKKYNNNKSGAFMAKAKLMGVKTKLAKAKAQKKWELVDQIAEDGLKVNPWDGQLNADQGEACQKLGYDETAIFGYKNAVSVEPECKEFNRALALLFEERGEYSEAIKCWERIYKVDKLDSEARSKMTQLQASTVMDRGGYESAKSTQTVRKSAYEDYRGGSATTKEAVVGPGVSEEEDLKHAIRKNPEMPENYLKLAEIQRREKRIEESMETYQKALEVSGGDTNIREQLEDLQLEQLRDNADVAREAAASGDEQAKKTAAALKRELVLREVEVLSARVSRYPKDSRLKYELARRFMTMKQWPKAIPLLQQASVDSRLEGDVLCNLGECFLQDGKTGLGRRQYEKAIGKLDMHESPENFKKAHYVLGRLCEEAGQTEDAENHYSEVLAIDYEYRDARERLENLQDV